MNEFTVSVRWGKDVQPYVSRLASGHIHDLRKYCEGKAKRILRCRHREITVVPITARVTLAMVDGKDMHRFRRLGFHFQLDEAAKQGVLRRAFVLHFATTPRFLPDDMPPRLRRQNGKALSARPRRRAKAKTENAERVLSRLDNLWVSPATKGRMSPWRAFIAVMDEARIGFPLRIGNMPRGLDVARVRRRVSVVLMSMHNCTCSARARLMEILTGERVGPILRFDTMVYPPTPWDAWLFGELPPPENERRAA